MPLQLPDNETLQGKWTLHYYSPDTKKYNGVLYLTDKNLYFEGSFEIHNMRVEAVEGGFVLPLEEIADVLTRKSGLIFNQIAIDMQNGSRHIFDRGIASVQKIKRQIIQQSQKTSS